MLSRVNTVAFNGLEILNVELQVQISAGMPAFAIVGLPDKAVAESRERIRAAFTALGLKLPAKRITVNLSPADLLKEGSHFDLPLALGLLVGMEVIPQEKVSPYIALGELGLDGKLVNVNGVLPAAMAAKRQGCGVICPEAQGSEAVWAKVNDILAAHSLLQLINFFRGNGEIPFPQARRRESAARPADMKDVKGQETAKRAIEIAAAGAHNLIMSGPPGAGKSMLAARLPSGLPPMTTEEAIETSMIHSIAGELKDGSVSFERPFRDPHHSASTPALVGGGKKARLLMPADNNQRRRRIPAAALGSGPVSRARAAAHENSDFGRRALDEHPSIRHSFSARQPVLLSMPQELLCKHCLPCGDAAHGIHTAKRPSCSDKPQL